MALRYFTHGRRDRPLVALTFDDGPNPPRTEEVLEILAGRDVRATFFVIGKWVDCWPDALERIIRAGHTVGNHGYLHEPGVSDFDRAEDAIRRATGRPSRFVRAPFLDLDLCLRWPPAPEGAVSVVDADVNPADWAQHDPDEILRRTLGAPHLAPGSILDLHDGAESEGARLARPLPLIAALPALIDGLHARGYQLAGLDELELAEPFQWPPTPLAGAASA